MKKNNESHLKIKAGLCTVNLQYTCTHRNTQIHTYRIRSASPLSRSGIITSFFKCLTHLYLGLGSMLPTISQSSCQNPSGVAISLGPCLRRDPHKKLDFPYRLHSAAAWSRGITNMNFKALAFYFLTKYGTWNPHSV